MRNGERRTVFDVHGVGDLARARRVLMLALLLRAVLASLGLGAARLETHDSSSYVALVCVKEHNARGQAHGLARDRAASVFLTAWLKPALLHWRDTAPVWMLHRCGGEPGGWQTRATGRRAPKRRYGVAASRRASLMATGEYII